MFPYRLKYLRSGKVAIRELYPNGMLSDMALIFQSEMDFEDWRWSGKSGEQIGRRLSIRHRTYKTNVGFDNV